VVGGAAVDLLRWEGGALVPGVARLAAALAFVLAWWRGGLGRLDDVGGRGLRRGRGVLAEGSDLLAQLGQLGLQDVDLRLQPLAVGAGSRSLVLHARYSIRLPGNRLGPLDTATLTANRQLIAQVATASPRHRITTLRGCGHRQRPRRLVSVTRSTTDRASASPPGHSGRPSASRSRCR